jgi:hypothetical protein
MNSYRNLGPENDLYDLSRGGHEPAGGVDLQDKEIESFVLRLLNLFLDIIGAYRTDGAIDNDPCHGGPIIIGIVFIGRTQGCRQGDGQDQEQKKDRSPASLCHF